MPKQYSLVTLDDGRRFYVPVDRKGRQLGAFTDPAAGGGVAYHAPHVFTRRARGMRGLGQGFDFSQIFGGGGGGGGAPSSGGSQGLTDVGNVIGAAVGVPGAGDIASGVVSTVSSIFGGNPATGKNAERQAHIYSIYETAMTSPGSSTSRAAVAELYAIANQIPDQITGVVENNPQATRTYAQQALQMLATQGWENVNSFTPVFTGVPASGVVYGANQATGQEQQIGVRPIAGAGMGSGTLLVLGIIGGFFLLSGRSKATATATVHHQNPRYRRRRRSRRSSRR